MVTWNEQTVHLGTVDEESAFRSTMPIPGETISDEFNWSLSVQEASKPITNLERASQETFVDSDRVTGQLYFRSWKPSDKMQPLGFSGHRKASDLMAEAGLTMNARRRLPVICDMIGPVWIPGVCLDERAKPGQESRNIWHFMFGPARPRPGDRNEAGALSVLR